MAANGGFTDREMLIEIRGDIAAIKQTSEWQAQQFAEHREKHHEVANTVQTLLADKHKRDGELIGWNKAVRAVYALSAVCGLGGVAAAAKVLLPALGAH